MFFNRAIVSLLPLMPRSVVWRFSRRYIAGTSLDEALDHVGRLNDRGISATLDVLGEDTTETDAAHESKRLYLEALRAIEARGLDCNISIKLSQMGLRFDPSLCEEIVRELVEKAEGTGNFVRIDMEDSSVTQITLDLYRTLRRQHSAVGAVVQACLRRTEQDVASLLAEGPTHLRLCKGIYVEPAEIAFQDREEIRASFTRLLEQMLTGGIRKVGIATHDRALVDAALALIERENVPRERFEFQMLLGVTERLRDRLVEAGHPLRVYVPFGEAWFPYSYRRLRENPQIAGHIIRNMFTNK